MKIAVITICTRNLNFGEYSIDNSREYCERHGYDFILYEDRIDSNAAVITNKTITVLQNIDNYDWIFMKDADSLFYNFRFKLENYIDDNYNYIGSLSYWQLPDIPPVVNLGQLLIKCTPEVKTELSSVLKVLRERVVSKGEQPIYNEFWNESKISPVKKLPMHVFNARAIGKEDSDRGWGRSMEELEELDRQGINMLGDIRNDTIIVHYPGVFLKTGSYVTERHVANGKLPQPFNFSKEYLPEFIKMYNKIKNRNSLTIIKGTKKVSKENCCGKRVRKAERKKINYKKVIRRNSK